MINQTIRLRKIIIVALVLVLFALVQIQGCGGNQTTAPQNYKITALNSGLAAPKVGAFSCHQPVTFLVTDTSGKAVNGISVQIHSGPIAQVAQYQQNNLECPDVLGSSGSDLVLTSGDDGTVAVEFLVAPITTGIIFFVDASSGAAIPAEVVTAASTT